MPPRSPLPVDQLFDRALSGDRRALARLFTRLERDQSALRNVMRLAYPAAGRASIIGITGPPGAGKSTIVDGLSAAARTQGKTVGVLAVDPTSPFTGGAVLGDRIRMQSHFQDSGVFIRSLATRGVPGGLNAVTKAGVKLLDAVGKDIVLVETVGVGQAELDVMGVADLVIVVLVPEAGDTVQTMKAGLLEVADIFVVNKADRDGAGQLASAIRAMIALEPRPIESAPPVLLTQADQAEGVAELYAEGLARIDAMRCSQELAWRRSRQASQEVTRLLKTAATEAVDVAMADGRVKPILASVEAGKLDPYSAAQTVLDQRLVHHTLTARARTVTEPTVRPNRVIGIDLTSSERKLTACAVLDSAGTYVTLERAASDDDILGVVRRHSAEVVAIDAPLGLPRGMDCLNDSHACVSVHPFKGRLCERELIDEGISLYLTTKRSIIKMMICRAISLAQRIRGLGSDVIEVYPYASKVALFGTPIPKKTTSQGRRFLAGKLSGLVPGLSHRDQKLDHDCLDALVAAHTAFLYIRGETQAYGVPDEAQIHVPKVGPCRAQL